MQIKTFGKTKDGKYRFNQLAYDVKPFWLVPDNAALNPTDPEEITIPASGASAGIPMRSLEEGGYEFGLMSAQRTDECLVNIFDEYLRRPLTGRPCHVDTIFGNGSFPFILPETIFLERRQTLVIQATDLSGNPNTIRPVLGGQRINPERSNSQELRDEIEDRRARRIYIAPFLSPLDEDVALTASQERDFYYTQEGVSNFEVKKLTFTSTGAFKFRVIDETGRRLTENWLHSSAVLGTAQNPYILFTPWVIRAGGKVQFTFRDLSGLSNTIYLTLSGRVFFV